MTGTSWTRCPSRRGTSGYAQILIYPKADATYTVRFWFVGDLDRFTEADDRATLDDEMILLHALANAKAHYRQPDAATYQGQLNTLLGSLRGQSFGSNGVYRRSERPSLEAKPAVVGRDCLMGHDQVQGKPPLGSGMAQQAATTLQTLAYRRHVQEAQALGQQPMTPQEFAGQRGG
jgi:hypothetical protein